MYEMKPLVESAYLKNKDSWEQTRLIAYMVAQVNSKKKLKPTDIISFAWDEEAKADTSVTDEDRERLEKKAELMSKYL